MAAVSDEKPTVNDNMAAVTDTYVEADSAVQEGTKKIRNKLAILEAAMRRCAESFTADMGRRQMNGMDSPEAYRDEVKQRTQQITQVLMSGIDRINEEVGRFRKNMKDLFPTKKDEDVILVSYTRGRAKTEQKTKKKSGREIEVAPVHVSGQATIGKRKFCLVEELGVVAPKRRCSKNKKELLN